MLSTHFRIAWRNLIRKRSFFLINIIGLAIGLGAFLLIMLYVADEWGFDRYNAKAGRIYRINADIHVNGNNLQSASVPPVMGPQLGKDYPGVEKWVRLFRTGDLLLRRGQELIREKDAAYADSTLFDVFTLPMIEGDPKTALTQPSTIVITEGIARKYFGSTHVVGKTILTEQEFSREQKAYTITGVIRDMPSRSHFHYSFIRPLSELPGSRADWWLSENFNTYVLLRPGINQNMLDGYIDQMIGRYMAQPLKDVLHTSFDEMGRHGNYFRYNTIPLLKIHLYSDLSGELEANGHAKYVYIFFFAAIFVLVLACINFMNLATARYANRAREVGIRKVLGSSRGQLIMQFLGESVLTSSLSLVLALLLAGLALPCFSNMTGKEIRPSLFSESWLIVSLFLITVLTGLFAGLYPALFLSAFRPAQVLKGKISLGFKGGWLRNALVVFQFVTAIFLILGALIIGRQLYYIQHKDLGYDRSRILIVHNTYDLQAQRAQSFKREIAELPGVINGTMTFTLPNSGADGMMGVFRDNGMTADQSLLMKPWMIDADYIPTLGMQIVRGRNFSDTSWSDAHSILLNESAATALGHPDPLGKTLYLPGDSNRAVAYTIIGVVKDFHAGSLHSKIDPMLFRYAAERSTMSFKIRPGYIPAVLAAIEKKYKSEPALAGHPFTYSFLEDDFNHYYQADEKAGKLYIAFSVLAVFIACLGLFGLVSYAAEQRTREIGIRKVLGATVAGLASLISRDFLRLVLLSCLLSFPIAWWAMNQWLQDFAYRISIGWMEFGVTALLAFTLTLLTVGFQATRAALANPVDSLREE